MLKNIILNYIKKPSKVKQNLLFFHVPYFKVILKGGKVPFHIST